MTDSAITVEGARKKHGGKGGKVALDGLDLQVARGTVHGVLGPNGAGKTTLVRILATLLRPDAGRVEVAGHDVVTRAREVRFRVGLLGQHAALDEELGGRQNLEMFGRLYHLGARPARVTGCRSTAGGWGLVAQFPAPFEGRGRARVFRGAGNCATSPNAPA